MSNTAPVVNAQSSDDSHAIMAAASSTSRKRFIGIFESMKSMCSCFIWSKISVLAAAGVMQFTKMFEVGQFLAERLGQPDQAGLGRRVVRGVRVAFLAGNRGDVHDPAPAVLAACAARRRGSVR